MIQLRLFGRCRIYHDPVSPVLKESAQIGWTSWFRDIDLVTSRKLKGKELLMRTRGWWTVEPTLVADVVEKYGKLMIGENGELMVELKSGDKAEELSICLTENFDDQILIAP
ncbi:MAG: hypothetical protein HOJ48_00720 [Desulfobacula sp.]|jgi:hypothetical protein|nr:hypothetical protein [Desulfobacula sp.]